jgi:protein-L-isoaspartate(D-aspartate) O-methyltransferase
VIAAPLSAGASKHGPYDVIIIEGAIREIPAALLDQLNEGGRIGALFMDGALGACKVGYKIDGEMTWRFAFNAGAPVLGGFEGKQVFAL